MDNLPFNSRIKDMQILERPRERLARMGAGVLSTAELLAILLRVGVTWGGGSPANPAAIGQWFTVQKMPLIWSSMR